MTARTFVIYGGITVLLVALSYYFVLPPDQPAAIFFVSLANVVGWLQGRHQSRLED